LTSCSVLVLAVGSAALGAGWGTSLLTSIAVACAIASSAVHRLGQQRSGCSLRTGLPSPARAENDADPSPWPTPPGRATTTRSESFADRVGSGV